MLPVGDEPQFDPPWPAEKVKLYRASAQKKVRAHGGSWRMVDAALARLASEDVRASHSRRGKWVRQQVQRLKTLLVEESVAHLEMHAHQREPKCDDPNECGSGLGLVRGHAQVLAELDQLVWASSLSTALHGWGLKWWQRSVDAFCFFLHEHVRLSHPEIAVLRALAAEWVVTDRAVGHWEANGKQAKSAFKKKLKAQQVTVPTRGHWGLRRKHTRPRFLKKGGGKAGPPKSSTS